MKRAFPRKFDARLILCLILVIAFALRCYNLAFGLPALFDPDEPTFILISLGMLKNHSLNPGWFGHPGTTTIYTLALIDLGVLLIGSLSGRFPNAQAFSQAVYLDPSLVFLPGRWFIVACGTACILLTYMVGRRLFGERTGLIAAALLAINALHISWSQLIRTDIHATVFMLLCVLCSINIARRGLLRDYLLAAIMVGLAAATKWPAAAVLVCPVGAGLLRAIEYPQETRRQLAYIILGVVASVASLIVISPYLVLDYHQAFANVSAEAQPHHLGATGAGFLSNAFWYLTDPIMGSVGAAGLGLGLAGAVLVGMRSRLALAAIVAPFVILFVVNSAQVVIWTRWALPLLPFLSIFIAFAIVVCGEAATSRMGKGAATALQLALAALVMLPMALTTRTAIIERLHDTRTEAANWARANVPPGGTIVIEHLAFDMLRQGWTLLLPASRAGCIDGEKSLRGETSYSTIATWRKGHAIVDLGTIDEDKLVTCRADFAIISDYDRYLPERERYSREFAKYGKFLKGGILVKTFRPIPGEIGGPVMRIVKLDVPGAAYRLP